MATYYTLRTSLQYTAIANGHGFILTQMYHDLVVPGLPTISNGEKPKSFISDIKQEIKAAVPSSGVYTPYLLTDPNGTTITVDATIITSDDKTLMSNIREKWGVLTRILAAETPDRSKIDYSLQFESGISLSISTPFDFDELIAGKIQNKAKSTLRKVAI